jgi:hypothetical protein
VCEERARQLEAEGQGLPATSGRRPARAALAPAGASGGAASVAQAAGDRRRRQAGRKVSKPTVDLRKPPASPPQPRRAKAPEETGPTETASGEEVEIQTGDIVAVIPPDEHHAAHRPLGAGGLGARLGPDAGRGRAAGPDAAARRQGRRAPRVPLRRARGAARRGRGRAERPAPPGGPGAATRASSARRPRA